MKNLRRLFFRIFVTVCSLSCTLACIWDATTLEEEKSRRHDLAEVILGGTKTNFNSVELLARLDGLQKSPRTNEVDWWNNLAGTYLRLGKAVQAALELEEIKDRFPNDYAVHANLGTAYHLMGKFEAAEREIARGLEIDPNAHFGLERYHLALLQYLIRDEAYQQRHVYVDEWTMAFLSSEPQSFRSPDKGLLSISDFAALNVSSNQIFELNEAKSEKGRYDLEARLMNAAENDTPPRYREKWNLAEDTNFVKGVVYMAELNSKEPAAFVAAGIAAFSKRDFNLGVAAFEKAIELGSPQTPLLKWRIEEARKYIEESKSHGGGHRSIVWGVGIVGLLILVVIVAVVGFFTWRSGDSN